MSNCLDAKPQPTRIKTSILQEITCLQCWPHPLGGDVRGGAERVQYQQSHRLHGAYITEQH